MATARLGSISKCSKLKVMKVIAIKSNYIAVFAAILPVPLNQGADSMAPTGRPFQRRC